MVLLIAIGAAAAAYQSKQNNPDGEKNGDLVEKGPDLTGKTAVDLLPLERTLGLFEAPISTITFMDGDPALAAEFLSKRVREISKTNPWLGGWLGQERFGAVKLFYDPSGDDICAGLFKFFDIETVKLTRDTSFDDHGELFDTHEVKVKCNAEIINARDSPLWRVSLIPDADYPSSRFALVISMSHMLGDGHTFFRIKDMLHTSGVIEALNPVRRHVFGTEAASHMGQNEVYYVDRVSRSPVWAKWGKSKPDETIIERKVFYINKEWVEGQKESCSKVAQAEAAASLVSEKGDNNSGLNKISEDDEGDGAVQEDVSVNNDQKNLDESTPPVTRASTAEDRKRFAVSFAAKQASSSVTTNDIITSAFFKSSSATVGLMPYNFRGRPGMSCNEGDAGNYSLAIPYTARDFLSPLDIQSSRQRARRAHADSKDDPTVLPPHKREHRYAISVDWRSFQCHGGLTIGPEGECRQVLQLPCYDTRELSAMPKTFSMVKLFNAGPNGEPAISVIAPQNVMKDIENSGVVQDRLFASVGTSEDAFATTVAETAAGRRQSVFAPLIDAHAMSGIEQSIEAGGEQTGEE